MSRPSDPRKANRRGATDSSESGYTAANDAPKPKRRLAEHDTRQPLEYIGCHLYEAPSPTFGGKIVVYQRCPAHQPPNIVATHGPTPGHCPVCEAKR